MKIPPEDSEFCFFSVYSRGSISRNRGALWYGFYNKCGQKCGQIKKLDDKTYVLTFNTLAGTGGFAKPRSKQQSAGLLLAAFGRPTCSNPTSSSTKKDPQPQLRISFGGSWWIRTTEALSSRFTVCPHWPLGKAPIFICAPALTVLD